MTYQRCIKGLWDTTVPGIKFDENGVSNFCKMQESLMAMYPRGEAGTKDWELIVKTIKKAGIGKRYDCIIGVSGGTDSSYLLHIAKIYGLRPLAVNLDNGWNSDISVNNIKKITQKLNIDLETYVIDYEEVKIALKSYILACLPWIDSPTDIAIKACLYKIAIKEGIKYILNGADFRSEGKQPLSWTYSDSRQMRFLVKKFYNKRLKSIPYMTLTNWFYYGLIRRIIQIRPFYFLPYNKVMAKELLEKEYDWDYYGGHHHENIFTKFAIAYWLPTKFDIDKRIISMSAQLLSGAISRDEGLFQLSLPPYDTDKIEMDIQFVIKKLDMTRQEFEEAFNRKSKNYLDYPSYFPLIFKFARIGKFVSKKIFSFKPGVFEAIDQGI